jgi:hypothetical protein
MDDGDLPSYYSPESPGGFFSQNKDSENMFFARGELKRPL